MFERGCSSHKSQPPFWTVDAGPEPLVGKLGIFFSWKAIPASGRLALLWLRIGNTLRDGWRYQNRWIFGKVPIGQYSFSTITIDQRQHASADFLELELENGSSLHNVRRPWILTKLWLHNFDKILSSKFRTSFSKWFGLARAAGLCTNKQDLSVKWSAATQASKSIRGLTYWQGKAMIGPGPDIKKRKEVYVCFPWDRRFCRSLLCFTSHTLS